MRALAVPLALSLLASGATSCATYEGNLRSGQRAFEQNEHERALALLRSLEPDLGHLSVVGRAQYAYLRGMTDFRIGYKSDARHWLALASALDQKTPGSLPADWEGRLSESLKQLNEEVYAAGFGSLEEGAPAPAEGESERHDKASDTEGADPSP